MGLRTTSCNLTRPAIIGGQPEFDNPVHVGRPNLVDRDAILADIAKVLDCRWFTNNGPRVQEFEELCANVLDVREFVATCNGTAALELATRATGMSGEVLTPAFTFIATAHCLTWQGIRPRFCDIDPTRHTLPADQIGIKRTPSSSGVLAVHLWGEACDVNGLQRECDALGLPLVYDASHAFGCADSGESLARFGTCSTFSFHATKFVSSFEGGGIATNDPGLAKKLRFMKNFGFEGYDRVTHLGTNAKMSEVSAVMGIHSIRNMTEFIAQNRMNYEAYCCGLRGIEGLSIYQWSESTTPNYQYVVATIEEQEAGIPRDLVVDALHAENILARRYFWPGCHRMEPYASSREFDSGPLPATDHVAERVIVFPTGTSMNAESIGRVCNAVKRIWDYRKEITATRQK